MIAPPRAFHPPSTSHAETTALAQHLAHAENALRILTLDQVDAIADPDGKIYLLRPAQEHLRQNERRLQAVIESAADVITIVDGGGIILSQSHAAKRVLGYEPGEMVGGNLFELIHEDDLPAVHFAFFNLIEGFQEYATTHFRHRTHDGSWCRIEATVGKLSDGAGSVVFSLRPILTLLPGHDEAATREAALVQASLAKDRFLAMLSHELRAPLTPALLGVQALEEDERFAEAQPLLTMIRRNIQLQSRLLEELIDFTTIGQHKVRLRTESIDAHEHVHFVLEICQGEITASQIKLQLDLRATENRVLADSVRLQQVMWNLLKNAIKFSPIGSTISITSINDTPGCLTLEFADQGQGIEPELLPLIFDAFQQGDHSIRSLHGGLGLGLYIAKGLVEAQGGTLTVASPGRGRGATFRLTLKNG